MGNSHATPKGKETIMKATAGDGTKKNMSFQATYKVGAKLGEGSFGMVHDCTKKDGSDETVYAVKMLEHKSGYMRWQFSKAKSLQWEEFAQEFEMLRRMDHPYVVKLHDVFVDRHFLYFVMDKYLNSLISAVLPLLQAQHSKTGNDMPSCVIGEISAHMLKSIAYLHDMNIVHRDVKADNYLVNSNTFKGINFKVVLTDLGTACQIDDDVLLKDTVGTMQYWAPEVVAKCYGKKVDCWAIGVVLWCMLTLTFPFKTAQEAYAKPLKFRAGKMTEEQMDLVKMLLEKNSAKRIEAKLALEHRYVTESIETHEKMVHGKKVAEEKMERILHRSASLDSLNAQEFGKVTKEVSEDMKEAREQALQKAQEAARRGSFGYLSEADMVALVQAGGGEQEASGDLQVAGKQRTGEAKQYSWWSADRCKAKGVPEIDADCTAVDATEAGDDDPAYEQRGDIALTEPANVEELTEQLKDFGVDTTNFGGVGQDSARAIAKLFEEIEGRECRMVLRGNTVIRIVDLLALRIYDLDRQMMLIEFEQTKDGTTKRLDRLPAKMRQAGGSGLERANNELSTLLSSRLGTSTEVVVVQHRSRQDQISYQQDSKSYPALTTVYRKTFFDGSINKGAPQDKLAAVGVPDQDTFAVPGNDEKAGSTTFKWCSEEELKAMHIKVKFPRRVLTELQHLKPIRNNGQLTEGQLTQVLQQHTIDVSKFGEGTARSIAQFVQEMNSGEAQLLSDGIKLRRHLDILIVKIKNPLGAYLIETGHTIGKQQSRTKNAFPATKVRPFEDKVWAVRRLLGEVDIPYSSSKIIFGPMRVECQESPSYPGVITVYAKQVIEVQLMEIDVANLGGMGKDKWFTQNHRQLNTESNEVCESESSKAY